MGEGKIEVRMGTVGGFVCQNGVAHVIQKKKSALIVCTLRGSRHHEQTHLKLQPHDREGEDSVR
jgi:hypothetical protein